MSIGALEDAIVEKRAGIERLRSVSVLVAGVRGRRKGIIGG